MSRTVAALLLAATVTLGGCSTVAQLATNMSTAGPHDATTFADATLAATLATQATDTAVNTGKLDRATLMQLSTMNDMVHGAWLVLKAANDQGQSLEFATFNAALNAFNAYAAVSGVSH